MRAPQQTTSDYTYLSDQQLIQTYIQLVTTKPVLDFVSDDLGYTVKPKQITVQQIRDTQVIQLTVENQDPKRSCCHCQCTGRPVNQAQRGPAGKPFHLDRGKSPGTDQANGVPDLRIANGHYPGIQPKPESADGWNCKRRSLPLKKRRPKLEQEIAVLQPAVNNDRKTAIAEKQVAYFTNPTSADSFIRKSIPTSSCWENQWIRQAETRSRLAQFKKHWTCTRDLCQFIE